MHESQQRPAADLVLFSGIASTRPLESAALPTQNGSGLDHNERRFPFFPNLDESDPEQAVSMTDLGARSITLEDRQLLPQSGILQRDLLMAGKTENDKSQYA